MKKYYYSIIAQMLNGDQPLLSEMLNEVLSEVLETRWEDMSINELVNYMEESNEMIQPLIR